MQQIIQFFQNNKIIVGIGATTVAFGALVYFNHEKETILEKVAYTQQYYEQKAKEYARKITLKKTNNSIYFDFDSIKQFLRTSNKLYVIEASYLTYKHRKERRELLDTDIQGYKRLIQQHIEDLAQANHRSKASILYYQNLNIQITLEQIQESIFAYQEKSNEALKEVQNFFIELQNQVKEQVYHCNDLSIKQAKEIARYYFDFDGSQLSQQQQEVAESSDQKLNAILQKSILQDYLYKNFGVEDEDLLRMFLNKELCQGDSELLDYADEYQKMQQSYRQSLDQ